MADGMPKGWRWLRLRDALLRIESGVSVNGADVSAGLGEYGVLKVSSVSSGAFNPSENKSITGSELARAKLNPCANSLIFSRANTPELVGAIAYVQEDQPRLFLSDKLWQITVGDESVLHPRWLAAVLGSEPYRRRLAELATGSSRSMRNISQEDFLGIEIPQPPSDEQCRLVAVLDEWNEAVSLAERVLTRLETRRAALIRKLVLGNAEQSAFRIMHKGRAPKDWRKFKLGQFAEEVGRVNRIGDELPVLSCTKSQGVVYSREYFGKQVYSKDTSTYKRVRRGEFVYATNHIEEGSIGLQSICKEGLVSPMYTVFSVDESQVLPGFLIALLKTETYRQIFSANTAASVDRRGSLRWNEFSQLPVRLPDLAEQARVVKAIANINAEVLVSERRMEALRTQKRGLMQLLLSGEKRLLRDLPGMETAT